jgi:hypothetical protein
VNGLNRFVRRNLWYLATSAVLLAVVLLFLYQAYRVRISDSINKVRNGMTVEEVIKIMGPPTADHVRRWPGPSSLSGPWKRARYREWLEWNDGTCHVLMDFDEKRRVKSKSITHVAPGPPLWVRLRAWIHQKTGW